MCLWSVESCWVDFTTRTAIAATGQPWTTAWTPFFSMEKITGFDLNSHQWPRMAPLFSVCLVSLLSWYPQRCWRSLNTYGGKTSWQAPDRDRSFDRGLANSTVQIGFWLWAHRCGKGRPDSKTIKTPMANVQPLCSEVGEPKCLSLWCKINLYRKIDA